MVNLESFKERFGNFDKEIVVEIIDIFIEEYDDRIKSITQYIENHNFDAFRKAIHAFKGVMANFEEKCIAYEKLVYMNRENSVVQQEIEKGRVFSENEISAFFGRIKLDFETFKPAAFEMLNDLKSIRSEYL